MINKTMNGVVLALKATLKDLRKFISGFQFDNIKIFLILLFTALYLPHCFILTWDLGLVLAYNTDSGTILQAITGLLDNYNFHDYMHSSSYGWTFFLINTVFLTPVKVFLKLVGHNNNLEILVFSARLLFFLIGLLSVILFNEILLKIFRNKLYAFMGSMFYIIGDLGFIFYQIHPETTGILFMFAAILALLDFLENSKNEKLYFYGLVFLTLSSLSKQAFFFTSLPILGIFLGVIFLKEKIGFTNFITSEKFAILTGKSFLLVFLVLLIVNPFLIFDFKNAIRYQLELLNHHNQEGFRLRLLSDKELIVSWYRTLEFMPMAFLCLTSTAISYFVAIFNLSGDKKKEYGLFLVMITSVWITFILIFLGNRLYVLPVYIAPIYPFCIINILALIKYFSYRPNLKGVRATISLLLISFFISALIQSIYRTTHNSLDRYVNYRKSMAFKSYEYVSKNIKKEDKIIHGPLAAIPTHVGKNSCNYWFEKECLKKINPNYIMIVRNFKTNGERSTRLKEIIKYVEENDMKLQKKIEDYRSDEELELSIYKK